MPPARSGGFPYSAASVSPNRPRVLLADDEADIRTNLAGLLTRSGFDVVVVEDGRAALDVFEAGGVDVAVLDVVMPEVDGREVVTLTGDCPKVTVTGGGNTVSVDRVGEIIVSGADNDVTWGAALDGTTPAITDTSVGNSIVQG